MEKTGRIHIETDEEKAIDEALLYPHYLHGFARFRRGPHTVFLRQGFLTVKKHGVDIVQGCHYDYSDRLPRWYTQEDIRAARELAKKKYSETKSAVFFQEYLRILIGNPELILVHILTGFNRSSGHPYHVYGYTLGSKEDRSD